MLGFRRALAPFFALTFLGGSCDTFFTIDATVTACDTKKPLPGVTATSHLHGGFGEEDHHETTDKDGNFNMRLNEPSDGDVTITLEKTGYVTWSRRYHGQPERHVEICLEPDGG
jgi:hypothetical protein